MIGAWALCTGFWRNRIAYLNPSGPPSGSATREFVFRPWLLVVALQFLSDRGVGRLVPAERAARLELVKALQYE